MVIPIRRRCIFQADSPEGEEVYVMKHNVYFDGKVQSLSLETAIGQATIGVITPGSYAFSTATEERMVVTSGILVVKLPGGEWKEMPAGKEFIVAANQTFEVEAKQDVSYICYYK
jgi:uncharacterized protein YaiE (UPF0345 family)